MLAKNPARRSGADADEDSLAALVAAALAARRRSALPAFAQEGEGGQPTDFPLKKPRAAAWSFAGFFGTFDHGPAPARLQVYKEVCSTCHSMNLVAFRNLGDEGGPDFTEDEVKALAASIPGHRRARTTPATCSSGRAGRTTTSRRRSRTPQAAAAANGGAAPPDLSLMAKARGVSRGCSGRLLDFFTQYQEGGPDYIHALLTGFSDPPAGVTDPGGHLLQPVFRQRRRR